MFLYINVVVGVLLKRSLLCAACLCASISSAIADILSPPARPISIVEISDDGTFTIEGDRVPYRYRLWGVEPDVDYFRDLVDGKTVMCLDAGQMINRKNIAMRVLECYVRLDGENIYLSGYLVQLGHGREICSETQNALQTCK